VIEVINLGKTFHDRKKGDIPAVKGISFTCSPGQVFGLLGRNGAGKTTTLRSITGLTPPRSGAITYKGASIAGLPAHRRSGQRPLGADAGRAGRI